VIQIGDGTTRSLERCALVALRYAEKMAEDPMKSFERYRRYAADCLKMAQSAANDGDKARLLQMAETWRQLAERAEARAARDDEDS
jgi:hypothetical protein